MRKQPKKYKSNNRVNLTYLKYQDRKKVSKKAADKTIEEFTCCPYCKSQTGYFTELIVESLSRNTFSFTDNEEANNKEKREKEVKEEKRELQVSNVVFKSKTYKCIDCEKAISLIKNN